MRLTPYICLTGVAALLGCGDSNRSGDAGTPTIDTGPPTGDAVCEAGESLVVPCGLNGREGQSHTCRDGIWHPTGPCEPTEAPADECRDGRSSPPLLGGGPNGRDVRYRLCVDGRFEQPYCALCEECKDDGTAPVACPEGLESSGRRCLRGYWTVAAPCAPQGECDVGEEYPLTCGPNGRGRGTLRCTDGEWPDPSTVACEGAGQCVDGAKCNVGCGGRNDRARATARCEQGVWDDGGACAVAGGALDRPDDHPACVDPDVCTDGAAERLSCHEAGEHSRRCIQGLWSAWSPCLAVVTCPSDDCEGHCFDGICGWPSCHDGRADPPQEGVGCGGLCAPCPNDPETCNLLDDDGDGAIDEGLGVGERCEGACGAEGVVLCAEDGGIRCTADDVPPMDEACNGRDDDCDDEIDEGADASCAALPNVSVGHCSNGACAIEPGHCDLGFEDADGSWRNGCEAPVCVEDALRVGQRCSVVLDGSTCICAGRWICVGGERGDLECHPGGDGDGQCPSDARSPTLPRELCNGLDDDCDGEVDERPPGGFTDCEHPSVADAPCVDGACVVPSCQDPGLDGDADNGCETPLACDAEGPCDRVMYPDLPANTCRWVGRKTCEVGPGGDIVEVCTADRPRAIPSGGRPEVCDGTDDDCDGFLDEGAERGPPDAACDEPGGACGEAPMVDDPCTAGVGGCRDEGSWACVGGRIVCDAVAGEPADEVCGNGVDEDCDGSDARCPEPVDACWIVDGAERVTMGGGFEFMGGPQVGGVDEPFRFLGRLREAGITGRQPEDDPDPLVIAEVGTAPSDDPDNWTWQDATLDLVDDLYDQYRAEVVFAIPQHYRVAFRFSVDGGISTTRCDRNPDDVFSIEQTLDVTVESTPDP